MAPARSNGPLPAALTPLLGRVRELEETDRLLQSTRLLTITGAGGSGKTRLALELAHRDTDRFEDGAIWVDLAPLTDPELIPQQILEAVGVREVATSDVIHVAIDTLRDRELLLVLDNCEHVIDASAAVVEAILKHCPGITILATTREPLGIAGEQTWLVPPLAGNDAAQLFVERARAVLPSFDGNAHADGIARVCKRLDGIPLAIELAAARVKVLSVEQIAERLDDAFSVLSSGSRTLPRHRTIRETIDWSFRLLNEREQQLLTRLSIFASSFSLDAAEALCGGEVLTSLSALVDKSLVICEASAGTRYRLLETVRQFAASLLGSEDEWERLRERHARYFLGLVEESEPKLFAGHVDPPTIAKIDRELDNIRALFDWLEAHESRSELALRLIWALHWYWFARGHFHEARRRIDTALVHASSADPLVRARAIVAGGNAAVWQAQWDMISPSLDDAIATLRKHREGRPLANALMLRGMAYVFAENRPDAAKKAFDEATEIALKNGRDVALALTIYWAAIGAHLRGDLATARAMLEEVHRIGVDTDSKPAIGHSMTVLGRIAIGEGNLDEALGYLRTAFDVHSETDDRWGLTQVIESIALVLLERQRNEAGIRLLAGASAAWLQLGARSWDDDDRIRRALTDPRLRVAVASGAAMSYEAMVAVAREELDRMSSTASPAAAPSSDVALRVRALGPIEIHAGNDLIDAAATGARARELLLYLLTQPAGATKEQIGVALWPDAEPSKLRNNFHVTLHRLRKNLGNIVRIDGEMYVINRNAVDFDAEVFEREATAAMKVIEKEPEAAQRLAAAIELYRGDFFPNATSEWQSEVRDRLRDLYSSALGALGRARMTAGDFAGAADVYERLVMMDEIDEHAVRNLMRCLARLGNTAAVSSAYRRLTSSLRRELGTEPDPATASLHARIVSGSE